MEGWEWVVLIVLLVLLVAALWVLFTLRVPVLVPGFGV